MRPFTPAVLAALLTACVASAGSGEPVSVRFPGRPAAVVAGSSWPATLRVSPADAGRPVLAARGGGTTRTFTTTAAGPGRWHTRVVLPTPGRWALSARLRGGSYPLASNGDVYVVAEERIRRVDAGSGAITTVAGTGARGFGGDGVPAAGSPLNAPIALAFAPDGDLVVAEYENRVRRIDSATGVITTVIGNGSEGYSGDGGPARAAVVSHPHGVAVEADGSIVVADSWNERVRRIDPGGTVETIPGGTVRQPIDVVVGPEGSLFVAGDNRVRRIGRNGAVRVVAGTGAQVSGGDGGPAARAGLNVPNSVAVAPDGTFYVCEFEGRRIRRVDGSTEVITTIAR